MGETRTWPVVAVAAALTLVLAVVAGVAASAAVAELTRGPSAAELRRAAVEEIAGRWERWPAGRVFPATLPYTSEQGGREQARRVGISSHYDCKGAVDTALRKPLAAAKCRAVLRATYLDALQGIEITVGVAAFPDESRAAAAKASFPGNGRPAPGLRALAFPGTVTDRFLQAGRQSSSLRQAGPYLVVTTAGQVDGRPARAIGVQRPTMFSFTADLAEVVAAALTAPARPDCAGREWRC
ncbi:hypothetical protein [Microbispora sp. ATCC PTA-5024]|uniref:hypothetical protein n=1 Tax=Microbispora sp. ATCC PTA-5024 TaxID=316330 RepID=UPI0003DDB38B|nr:hypothetical protein [Microbispora sp. ATCC PTA-5024]ETK31182.1 hypothetical protein MPTA5024_36095 [Microbispora sp. ATCC PTA-5024]